jgi:hypothetical protein
LQNFVSSQNFTNTYKQRWVFGNSAHRVVTCRPPFNPLYLAVIGAARFTVYRLNCQGEWGNTGLGHTKLEFFQKYAFTLKQDRILTKISVGKTI